MGRFARQLAVVAAISFGLGLAVAAPMTATAGGDNNCPHGGNPTSSACFYGVTQTGASTHFHNNTITIASPYLGSGVHVNESIWTYSGSPCNLWVETGYTRGYRAYTGYTYYIGWNDSVNGYNDQQSTTTTPDGSDHIYSLLWTGGTTYQTIRDGLVLRTSSGYGSGSCISQAGLEVSGNTPLSAYHADTFNDTPLQYRNTAGSFISGGWTSSWIDFPCGAGYSTPNCLNGTFYGNNQWANNKP